MKEISYKGKWWIPGRSKQKIVGELRFSAAEGVVLELSGTLEPLPSGSRSRSVPLIPVILGITSSGDAVTVLQSFRSSVNMSGFPVSKVSTGVGFPVSKYKGQTIIVGYHYRRTSSIRFESAKIEYQHLREWLRFPGIHYSSVPHQQVTCSFDVPAPVRFSIEAQSDSTFEFSSTAEFSSTSGEVKLTERVFLEIIPKRPQGIELLLESIFGFKDFLSLAVASSVEVVGLSAKVVNGTYTVKVGDHEYEREVTVQIYFSTHKISDDVASLNALDMMFTLDDVRSTIGSKLNLWFEKRNILKPAIDLFIAVQRGDRLYVNTRLLFMAQAVETYHRRAYPENSVPTAAHRQRLKDVIDASPVEFQEWLTARLQYSHEPNLRHRLKHLIKSHSASTKQFIPKPNHFAEKAVLTRNYLTHYDAESAKGAVFDTNGQYDLSQDLKLLLEICLLSELGFSEDELANFTKKRLTYGHHKLIPFST